MEPHDSSEVGRTSAEAGSDDTSTGGTDAGQDTETTDESGNGPSSIALACSSGVLESSLAGARAYFSDDSGLVFHESTLVNGEVTCGSCPEGFGVSILGLNVEGVETDLTILGLDIGDTEIDLCAEYLDDPSSIGPWAANEHGPESHVATFDLPSESWANGVRHAYSVGVPGNPFDAYASGVFTPPATISRAIRPDGQQTIAAFAVADTGFPDFAVMASSFAAGEWSGKSQFELQLPSWGPPPGTANLDLVNSGPPVEYSDIYYSRGVGKAPLYITLFSPGSESEWSVSLGSGEATQLAFPVIPQELTEAVFTYVGLGRHSDLDGFYETKQATEADGLIDFSNVPRPLPAAQRPTLDSPVVSWAPPEFATDGQMLLFEGRGTDFSGEPFKWWLLAPGNDTGQLQVPTDGTGFLAPRWELLAEGDVFLLQESWCTWSSRLARGLVLDLGRSVGASPIPDDDSWNRWAVRTPRE